MDLFNIRKDFTLRTLNEKDALENPIEMLQLWLNEAMLAETLEPTAMTHRQQRRKENHRQGWCY